MQQLNLKIVTPEKEILSEIVDQVNVPTSNGEIGILPHHLNLMTKITPGELVIRKNNKLDHLAIGDGFLQVSENVVTILTDMALSEESIDVKAVEEAKKRAEKALEEKLSDEEYAETLAVLERSLVQLRVKRRHSVR